MASETAVAAVLGYLHELYPSREIGPSTAEAWSLTFADWDDGTFTDCARKTARESGRTFFPTPGEVAAHLPASVPVFDSQKILRQIEKLSTYSAAVGMIAPAVCTVRDAMGDLIADAYASAGSNRLLADDATTRAIAERDFQRALVDYAAIPDRRVLVESAPQARQLSNRKALPESLASIVQRALPASA